MSKVTEFAAERDLLHRVHTELAVARTTNDYDGANITIKKNTFQNNAADLVFYPYGTVNHPFPSAPPVTATIRCNSFLSDVYSTVTDPIGIWLKDMAVIDQGLATSGDGNEFPYYQWASPTTGSPQSLLNDNQALSSNRLDYKYFVNSNNENVNLSGTGPGRLFQDLNSPTNICGGRAPGINSRQYISSPVVAELDSLRRNNLTVAQQTRTLKGIRVQPVRAEQISSLENLLTSNTLAPSSQQALGLHLLQFYRTQADVANIARLRGWLRQHVLTDAELKAYLAFTQATDQAGSFLPGLHPLPAVSRTLLNEVAISGTTSAFMACRLLRTYEPTCACMLRNEKPIASVVSRTVTDASLRLTAYPNPAGTVLHVPYALPAGVLAAELRAYDALGRLVLRQPLTGLQGETAVEVQHWPTGLYQFTLVADGHVQGQQRIVVAH